MKKHDIIITHNAQTYLTNSISQEQNKNIILYISIAYPFTKDAYVTITYCTKNDLNVDDIELNFNTLSIYIEKKSIPLLKNAIIDFKNEYLLINAPHVYNNAQKPENLKEKVKYLFENEINVILSQHGGFIELIDIINNEKLIIKFHGGCQGCGMVSYTLNNYIEKIIKTHFPNITSIDDVTKHEIKNTSYY